MKEQHGVSLLESEMQEIENCINKETANQAMSPKEWFEQVYIGLPVKWGTNTFTDNVVVNILEEYNKYLTK
jgi:hypothetical protein